VLHVRCAPTMEQATEYGFRKTLLKKKNGSARGAHGIGQTIGFRNRWRRTLVMVLDSGAGSALRALLASCVSLKIVV